MIRVVLADHRTVVRAGFRALLDLTDDLVVVAEAADGERAVSYARSTRPDVVLMDIRMPVLDGLAATRRIAADPALDGVRVLILTAFDADEYVFEALRAGAAGFLPKDVEPAGLRDAIRTVAAGHGLPAPSVTRRVIEEFVRLRPPLGEAAARLARLTAREREVLTLVGTGLSDQEIGRRLSMSPFAAKNHVGRVLSKLGARDRVQLVVLAYETGLVRPRGELWRL